MELQFGMRPQQGHCNLKDDENNMSHVLFTDCIDSECIHSSVSVWSMTA